MKAFSQYLKKILNYRLSKTFNNEYSQGITYNIKNNNCVVQHRKLPIAPEAFMSFKTHKKGEQNESFLIAAKTCRNKLWEIGNSQRKRRVDVP